MLSSNSVYAKPAVSMRFSGLLNGSVQPQSHRTLARLPLCDHVFREQRDVDYGPDEELKSREPSFRGESGKIGVQLLIV